MESNAFFFNCLLSSIVLRVSGDDHSDMQVFVYPIVSLADSIIAVLDRQCRFILEDVDTVPERDAELLLDECVLQLLNVWSLVS